MILMKNICKTYQLGEGGVAALKDVSFHIKPQEFVSLLGPSGSGKSTLMNIIGCLDVADSGEYLLEGRSIENFTEDQLSEIRGQKIGFVFQAYNLLNDLNAYENVEMPLWYHKLSGNERSQRVTQALTRVGLAERMHHQPSQLSGGEQQRVAIARALVTHPAIILADEPTGNLDSKTGKEIMAIFKELWHSGNTIIVITHDINVAAQAQRKLFLHDGRLSNKEVRA